MCDGWWAAIQLKSFLTGSPEIKLGLNQGLTVKSLGIVGGTSGGGAASDSCLAIDDMGFHESLCWDEQRKTPDFSLYVPDGEFTLLTYRISCPFRPPILLTPFLETQVHACMLRCVGVRCPGVLSRG